MEAEPRGACPLCDTPFSVLEEAGNGEVTWFKVDDGFHSHPKVLTAGNEAIGLWVRCGSYCSQHLTEGRVPRVIALMYGDMDLIDTLVKVGLFVPYEDDWMLHDFGVYNPTREQVVAVRNAAAERQRNARERARQAREAEREKAQAEDADRKSHGVTDNVTDNVTSGVTDSVSHAPPGPSRPGPSRTSYGSTGKTSPASAGADDGSATANASEVLPEGFEEFWRAYPRRIDKKAAVRAYQKALTKVSPAVLVANAGFYAMEKALTEKEFIKYPATWLNGECWTNEPATTPAPAPVADEAATLPPIGSAPAPAGDRTMRASDDYGGDAHMARYLARAEARRTAGQGFP